MASAPLTTRPPNVRHDRPEVLVAAGELDLATADDLRDRLADTTITTVDLADVTFLDMPVLSVLVAAHQARAGRGGLSLRAPSEPVRRILRLSGVDDYLPVDPGNANPTSETRRPAVTTWLLAAAVFLTASLVWLAATDDARILGWLLLTVAVASAANAAVAVRRRE